MLDMHNAVLVTWRINTHEKWPSHCDHNYGVSNVTVLQSVSTVMSNNISGAMLQASSFTHYWGLLILHWWDQARVCIFGYGQVKSCPVFSDQCLCLLHDSWSGLDRINAHKFQFEHQCLTCHHVVGIKPHIAICISKKVEHHLFVKLTNLAIQRHGNLEIPCCDVA